MPRQPAGYAVDNNLLGIRYSTMRFSRMVDVLVMSTYGGRVKDSDDLDFRLEPAETEHGRKEVKYLSLSLKWKLSLNLECK